MNRSVISKKNLLIVATISFYGTGTLLSMHKINKEAEQLLGYNPEYEILHTKAPYDQIMITCHGSGANKEIGRIVAEQVKMPVITFNFPDANMDDQFNLAESSFGTINEYLPLIYLLHELVKSGIKKISLYGFSAGGGAIINSLSILNSTEYRTELLRLGISGEHTPEIFAAIARGTIILDSPLKSVTEILSIRPHEEFIQVLSKRFKKNGFEPIDRLDMLKGLATHILLYFEKPDEILSNRDDELYYHKLKAINNGTTELITGHDGGHNGFHRKLWASYNKHS